MHCHASVWSHHCTSSEAACVRRQVLQPHSNQQAMLRHAAAAHGPTCRPNLRMDEPGFPYDCKCVANMHATPCKICSQTSGVDQLLYPGRPGHLTAAAACLDAGERQGWAELHPNTPAGVAPAQRHVCMRLHAPAAPLARCMLLPAPARCHLPRETAAPPGSAQTAPAWFEYIIRQRKESATTAMHVGSKLVTLR